MSFLRTQISAEAGCLKLSLLNFFFTVQVRADPRLLGPYAKLCRPGGLVSRGYEWNAFVRISLRIESPSRKALKKLSFFT